MISPTKNHFLQLGNGWETNQPFSPGSSTCKKHFLNWGALSPYEERLQNGSTDENKLFPPLEFAFWHWKMIKNQASYFFPTPSTCKSICLSSYRERLQNALTHKKNDQHHWNSFPDIGKEENWTNCPLWIPPRVKNVFWLGGSLSNDQIWIHPASPPKWRHSV